MLSALHYGFSKPNQNIAIIVPCGSSHMYINNIPMYIYNNYVHNKKFNGVSEYEMSKSFTLTLHNNTKIYILPASTEKVSDFDILYFDLNLDNQDEVNEIKERLSYLISEKTKNVSYFFNKKITSKSEVL